MNPPKSKHRGGRTAAAILFMFGAVLMTGCHKNDPAPALGSYTLQGVETGLAHGYYNLDVLELDENSTPGRWYTIMLTTAGVTISGSQEQGNGDLLYVEVFSKSVDELLPDTYAYFEHNVVGVFRLTVFQGFESSTGNSEKIWFGESGTLSLTKSDDVYQLNFSATIEDKDTGTKLPVSGSFEGALSKVD